MPPLKNTEKMRNIYVESPFGIEKDTMKDLKQMFPDKKIISEINPSLIAGTKITYNDDVFQMNLKNSLDTIINNIENYD